MLHPDEGFVTLHETGDSARMRKALPGSVSPTLKESALLSGGEGQRVRLGRALQRKQARLVILDEPFRGVDSLEVRRARKALAPITSSSAF